MSAKESALDLMNPDCTSFPVSPSPYRTLYVPLPCTFATTPAVHFFFLPLARASTLSPTEKAAVAGALQGVCRARG